MRRNGNILELDVRPYLRQKLEPFKQIMEAVDALGPNDVFVLHATFKPTPLLGVLKVKGYTNKLEEHADDHWVVGFARGKEAKEVLETLSLHDIALAAEQEGTLG